MLLAMLVLAAALPLQAAPPIDTAASCALTVRCAYAGTPLVGMRFSLYCAATVAADGSYTRTADFAESGVQLNDIDDAHDWRTAAETLAAYASAARLAPLAAAVTDAEGEAAFAALTPGLYLAAETRLVSGRRQYVCGAFLVALPGITDAGVWQYDCTAIAKIEEKPYTPPDPVTPTEPAVTTAPDETTASGETTAPEETTVPGETTAPEETIVPGETTVPGEITIPDETTEPGETTIPGETTVPGETTEPGETTASGDDLPQTGQLKWPVPVLFTLGVLLSILGIWLRRRDDDA